jgi:hypothetical protein
MKRYVFFFLCAGVMFSLNASPSIEDDNPRMGIDEMFSPCSVPGFFDMAGRPLTYGFECDFPALFKDHPAWSSRDAELAQSDGKIRLSATGTRISEAWKTWRDPMPYNKSWKIAVDVSIPHEWDTVDTPDAQVGGGPWVGKLEPDGKGRRVYEVNHASIARRFRFVQGQLIKNRLGEDPINVEHKEVVQEAIRLVVIYCAIDHTISLYADGEHIDTQSIDSRGMDNWGMTDNDVFYVGIMGFAENTDLRTHYVTMDNYEVCLKP